MAAASSLVATSDGRRGNDSSATWATSSGGVGISSETDEVEDRFAFVDEYNRLAKKHGVRLMVQNDRDLYNKQDHRSVSHGYKRGWFSRHFRRNASTGTRVSSSTANGSIRKVSARRSLSDMAAHIMHRDPKRDGFKDEDLQTLVRLCGQSKLFLPSDYAPASLVLPTCLRATAQYLVQYGTNTKGIFRTSGSAKTTNAIYSYYCPPTQGEADKIDTTVSSPNLPTHFNASVHDVASTFKRFLAGLPGGILGSLSLFDALIAIHSQLHPDPESTRTKQSKLRARLIALAIGTLKSQYRRELICAVFGLLCLVGRTAERAPREDEKGRPLPTSDLMGYKALGVVFGPLLVGDLLDAYTMHLAHPDSGLVLLPLSPLKSRRERRKSRAVDDADATAPEVDKISVANSIAEMVVTHWREIVRHMKNLEALRRRGEAGLSQQTWQPTHSLRPSASESFATLQQVAVPGWGQIRSRSINTDTAGSPMPRQRSFSNIKPPVFMRELRHVLSHPEGHGVQLTTEQDHEPLVVKRKRPSSAQLTPSHRLPRQISHALLSPTSEELPSAKGHVHHDEVQLGTIQDALVHQGSVDQGKVIHSPIPRSPVLRSPVLRSPILRTPSHDLTVQAQSVPPVDFMAAMREPRRSDPGSVNLTGRKQSGGSRMTQGSHNRGHTRTPPQSARRGSSPSASPPRWKETHTHPIGGDRAHSPSKSVKPMSQEHRDPTGLPPGAHFGNVPVTPGTDTSRIRSDNSFDSGYFRDNEQVVIEQVVIERVVIEETVESTESRDRATDAGLETPTIFGAFPGSDPISQGPLNGSSSEARAENSARDAAAGHTIRQSSRAAVTPLETEEQLLDQEDLDAAAVVTSQLPGSFPSRGSWLRRISLSKSIAGRQSDPVPMESAEEAQEPASSGYLSRQDTPDMSDRATRIDVNTKGKPHFVSSSGRLRSAKAIAARFENRKNDPRSLHSLSLSMRPRKSKSMTIGRTPQAHQDLVSQPVTPQQQPATPAPNVAHEEERLRMLTPGRMTPSIEHPPIARHISHRLIPRSATPSSQGDNIPSPAPSPLPPPGLTAALYAQVRNLQRQLATKTEEAGQLRRRIEAMEGGESGMGTLSERLRTAEREAAVWKDRALAAEKRVVVFERFLGRVRQLRDREKEKVRELYGGGRGGGGESDDVLAELENEVASAAGGGGVHGQASSAAETEESGLFHERIRKGLMAMDGAPGSSWSGQEVYDEDEEASLYRELIRESELEGEDDEDFSASLLIAAREVLEHEDMRRWLNGTC